PAVEEHSALQPRQPAEQRPTTHLALGDKRTGDQRTEHGDIDIRDMIRGEQYRTRGDRMSDPTYPEAENPATPAVVKPREGGDPGPSQQQADGLHRHQRHGPGEIQRETRQPQHGRADAIYAVHASFDLRS